MGRTEAITTDPVATFVLDTPSPVHASTCPVEDWLGFLGHRWTALILWHLQDGMLRHAELQARLPSVTPKVLSERLARLERRNLIAREILATFPRGVSYTLTARGRRLMPILDQIELWAKAAEKESLPASACSTNSL